MLLWGSFAPQSEVGERVQSSSAYALTDAKDIRRIVAEAGAGELITADKAGRVSATLLPLIWEDQRVILHMSRANPQWRSDRSSEQALIIVTSAHCYISPTWYPSKAVDGRVVPTWDYVTVHLRGRMTVHRDRDWLRNAVTQLTAVHEQGRPQPWSVNDAPAGYIDRLLLGIVGLEVTVESVEAVAKLSQNRSVADRSGVVEGLRSDDRPAAQAIGRMIAENL